MELDLLLRREMASLLRRERSLKLELRLREEYQPRSEYGCSVVDGPDEIVEELYKSASGVTLSSMSDVSEWPEENETQKLESTRLQTHDILLCKERRRSTTCGVCVVN